MTTLELALNTLAEAATTDISRHRNPQTMNENKQVANSGGNAAKLARQDIEQQIGHSVLRGAELSVATWRSSTIGSCSGSAGLPRFTLFRSQ